MKARRINADKPHLWKADIAASVDGFNQWFMRVAPEAFRSTRVETTEHVKAALLATNDLRTLNAAALKANPGALPTLRICAARRQHPSRGPAKLLDWLRPRHPGADLQRAIHALPTERTSQ